MRLNTKKTIYISIALLLAMTLYLEKDITSLTFNIRYKSPITMDNITIKVPTSMRYKESKNSIVLFSLYRKNFITIENKHGYIFTENKIKHILFKKNIQYTYLIEQINGHNVMSINITDKKDNYPDYMYFILNSGVSFSFFNDDKVSNISFESLIENITISPVERQR